MPKSLKEARIQTHNLHDIRQDLRASDKGAVIPLSAFPRFREMVLETRHYFAPEFCNCEDKTVCSFCSPHTYEIEKKIREKVAQPATGETEVAPTAGAAAHDFLSQWN